MPILLEFPDVPEFYASTRGPVSKMRIEASGSPSMAFALVKYRKSSSLFCQIVDDNNHRPSAKMITTENTASLKEMLQRDIGPSDSFIVTSRTVKALPICNLYTRVCQERPAELRS